MATSSEAELIRQLKRARALHEERAASPELAAALDRLALWQSRRLNATYADFARDPRYARAIEFFQTDLYGPGDFSRRDADLARVVPLMVRILPEGVIATISDAMELSALSRELDRALLEKLPMPAPLSVTTYCAGLSCARQSWRTRTADRAYRRGRSRAGPLRRQDAHPLRARRDAATGPRRGLERVAGFPGARFCGIPAHGGRRRVPRHG